MKPERFALGLLVLGLSLLLARCGGEPGTEGDGTLDPEAQQDPQIDPAMDPVADPVPDDTAIDDAVVEEEAVPDGPPDTEADAIEDVVDEDGPVDDCAGEVEAIRTETGIVGSCSAVLRLDYETRAILGWQLFCGSYGGVTESDARAQAQTDTGYGASGSMLNPADPDDLFVFYQAPGDFGGAAVVSARTGLSVFGGSIIWMGTGEISYPTAWRPAESLGSDCPAMTRTLIVDEYDLRSGTPSLPSGDADAAMDVLWQTALPEAMMESGYVNDAAVILYPRTMGGFDPTTAEWIVILNGGWLEG